MTNINLHGRHHGGLLSRHDLRPGPEGRHPGRRQNGIRPRGALDVSLGFNPSTFEVLGFTAGHSDAQFKRILVGSELYAYAVRLVSSCRRTESVESDIVRWLDGYRDGMAYFHGTLDSYNLDGYRRALGGRNLGPNA